MLTGNGHSTLGMFIVNCRAWACYELSTYYHAPMSLYEDVCLIGRRIRARHEKVHVFFYMHFIEQNRTYRSYTETIKRLTYKDKKLKMSLIMLKQNRVSDERHTLWISLVLLCLAMWCILSESHTGVTIDTLPFILYRLFHLPYCGFFYQVCVFYPSAQMLFSAQSLQSPLILQTSNSQHFVFISLLKELDFNIILAISLCEKRIYCLLIIPGPHSIPWFDTF